jgi:hypothetical protein
MLSGKPGTIIVLGIILRLSICTVSFEDAIILVLRFDNGLSVRRSCAKTAIVNACRIRHHIRILGNKNGFF